ncbi:MAG: hypothetical protein U1E58_10160 [Tabrizicola sp.]
MAVYSIAGSKFEIGAAVATKSADFVAGDFTTPMTTPSAVGEPETLGSLSDGWEGEDFGNVTDGRIRTVKTMRKGSTMELTCGLDPTDAGQLAMRAAHAVRDNYAMRLTLADKPATGASPKNSTRTFVGTVMNVEDDPSGKLGKVKFTIQINSNIVVTHASPT